MVRHLTGLAIALLAAAPVWAGELDGDSVSKERARLRSRWKRLTKLRPALLRWCCLTISEALPGLPQAASSIENRQRKPREAVVVEGVAGAVAGAVGAAAGVVGVVGAVPVGAAVVGVVGVAAGVAGAEAMAGMATPAGAGAADTGAGAEAIRGGAAAGAGAGVTAPTTRAAICPGRTMATIRRIITRRTTILLSITATKQGTGRGPNSSRASQRVEEGVWLGL